MTNEEWLETFWKTKLATQGGSCWECCEYEDMVNEMLAYLQSVLEDKDKENSKGN